VPYATRDDLAAFGFPDGTLDGIDTDTQDKALGAASELADGALSTAGYRTPLATWSTELTRIVVHIAAHDLMARRGFNPSSPSDAMVRLRFQDAQAWLDGIAQRKRKVAVATEPPAPDPVPAPVAVSGAPTVRTNPRRGY
jgi:phage gp36-like protein